jgi:hypothetical protein
MFDNIMKFESETIIVYLIDIEKKVRIFYKNKKLFCSDFFI